MKVLCKVVGGSHMYGLNTPASDYDERYIFMNTEAGKIIGLERFDHIEGRSEDEDKFGFELRHYFNLLKKINAQVIEMLFAEEYLELDPLFKKLVIDNRWRFIDRHKFYISLKGYMFAERRKANGERTGKLGEQRREAIDKYGYSPKNFVQLFRLAYAGEELIRGKDYPVNIMKANKAFGEELLDIKTQPQYYNVDYLNEKADKMENLLDATYNELKSSIKDKFDEQWANDVLLMFYYPELRTHYERIYNSNNKLESAIIVDIDGTIADISGRSPYDYSKVFDDAPIAEVCALVANMKEAGYHIIYLSGRPESTRQDTLKWLKKYSMPEGPLYLSADKDKRSSTIIKTETYNAHIKDKYAVQFALEDRGKNVKAWRELGIRCLQVDEGDF
jgi:predicted nucleotidyltransferase